MERGIEISEKMIKCLQNKVFEKAGINLDEGELRDMDSAFRHMNTSIKKELMAYEEANNTSELLNYIKLRKTENGIPIILLSEQKLGEAFCTKGDELQLLSNIGI